MSANPTAQLDQLDAAIAELRGLILDLAESVQIVAATVEVHRQAIANVDARVGNLEGL